MALTGTSASSVKARNRSLRFKRRQRCSSLGFTTTRSPNNAAQTDCVGSDTCSILAPEGAGRPNYKHSRLSPEPLSAPGQTTFPAPPAPGQPCCAIWPLYLQYERRDHKESKQACSSRQKSQPQVKGRARVLNFKARDQISQSRCCDCVKISSESFYCSLSPQDSESLAKNFFPEA